MAYQLIGSAPSPFTRRLRLLMENTPHEFRALDIYSPPGAAELKRLNPTNQIPVLIDNGQTVFDSRVIFNHLNQRHQFETMTIEKENALTVAEGMMNGGVAWFLMVKRSGVDPQGQMMYLNRQIERMQTTHEWLMQWLLTPAAKEWNFVTMTVYAAYDWMKFRDIHAGAKTSEVADFLSLHQHRPSIQATDPRKLS